MTATPKTKEGRNAPVQTIQQMTDTNRNDTPSGREPPELSVAVMAYNEEKSLDAVIEELAAELERLRVSYEVLLIDDGSADRTGEIAAGWAERDRKIRVTNHPRNLGLGEVYRTAFRECRGDFVTFFPADGQFSPSVIGHYLAKNRRVDLVLGYTEQERRDAVSELLSRAERVLFRLLMGSLPEFRGIIMFRRSLLERFELKSTGRGQMIMLELILRAHRAGHAIDRQRITILPRREGKSKVNNLRTIWANAVQLLRLRMMTG